MSLPEPKPGLLVCYSYLWKAEQKAGSEEGNKDRPCVIASRRTGPDGGTLVLLLPVTHKEPESDDDAIEIPLSVKRALGMDSARSWIVLSEANEAEWPPVDLRLADRNVRGKYDYGFLPPGMLTAVNGAVIKRLQQRQLSIVSRIDFSPR